MKARFYLLILTGCLIAVAGCNQDAKKVTAPTTASAPEKKPALTDPFVISLPGGGSVNTEELLPLDRRKGRAAKRGNMLG